MALDLALKTYPWGMFKSFRMTTATLYYVYFYSFIHSVTVSDSCCSSWGSLLSSPPPQAVLFPFGLLVPGCGNRWSLFWRTHGPAGLSGEAWQQEHVGRASHTQRGHKRSEGAPARSVEGSWPVVPLQVRIISFPSSSCSTCLAV